MGHQGLPEHLARDFSGLLRTLAHVDAALESVGESALSAAARVDLRFDDDRFLSEAARDFHSFLRGGGDSALGGGNAKLFKKLAGLVFVDVHSEIQGSREKETRGGWS